MVLDSFVFSRHSFKHAINSHIIHDITMLPLRHRFLPSGFGRSLLGVNPQRQSLQKLLYDILSISPLRKPLVTSFNAVCRFHERRTPPLPSSTSVQSWFQSQNAGSRTGLNPTPAQYRRGSQFCQASPFSSSKRSAATGTKGKKTKTIYVCSNCGEDFSQWWGECKFCKEMNTLKEFKEPVGAAGKSGGSSGGGGAAARALERLGPLPVSVHQASEPSTEHTSKSAQATNAGSTGGSSRSADSGAGSSRQSTRRQTSGGWVTDMVRPQRLTDVERGGGKGSQSWRIQLRGEAGEEIARVLGGGIVPGSLILVGGDPGVGKSTLLLQVAGLLAEGAGSSGSAPVLYVSGEESVEQVANRAERMSVEATDLFLYSATDMESILESIATLAPRAVVVDSIQTVFLPEATGSAGSVSQVRECATALLHTAKRTHTPIFLIGHVTKTGDIAGPRVLEHIVDVVLYMEGERFQSHRLLRGVKNRYGATDEVGVFEMGEGGLEAVSNPSELFLSERSADSASGASAAVAVTVEGTRPLLLEIQALCSQATHPPARRTANGVDRDRLSLLIAVLGKIRGLSLGGHDVFVNVVGGLELREPATDLAVAVALASSKMETPVPMDMAFVGEIGLGGELRSVGQLNRRLAEAAKLGFKRCIVPRAVGKSGGRFYSDLIETIPCANMRDVLLHTLGTDVRGWNSD